MWRTDRLAFDVAALPEGGLRFPMAVPQVQAEGCPVAVQTTNLALHPGYVHPDSIGNYMMEYLITMTLINNEKTAHTFDLSFGKTDQKIGLVYQITAGPGAVPLEDMQLLPVQIAWAGKGSEGVTEPHYETSLVEDGPMVLQPGEANTVTARLMVLGTSSLPYDLWLTSEEVVAEEEEEAEPATQPAP